MARQKKTEQKETKQKKSESKKVEPLMGEELINKVKDLGNLSKEEKAKACGYYMTTKNGLERINMMQFLNVLRVCRRVGSQLVLCGTGTSDTSLYGLFVGYGLGWGCGTNNRRHVTLYVPVCLPGTTARSGWNS